MFSNKDDEQIETNSVRESNDDIKKKISIKKNRSSYTNRRAMINPEPNKNSDTKDRGDVNVDVKETKIKDMKGKAKYAEMKGMTREGKR